MANILILNGSVRGASGNTAHMLQIAAEKLRKKHTLKVLHLAQQTAVQTEDLVADFAWADAFVLGTGTYWNNCSACLQRLIEVMTPYEGTETFLNKPVVVMVTMDSVGGIDVASRLLTTFNLLGCQIPQMASVVLSRVGFLAAQVEDNPDVWSPDDIACTIDNLDFALAQPRQNTASWPVFRAEPMRGHYPATGILHADLPTWPKAWWAPQQTSDARDA